MLERVQQREKPAALLQLSDSTVVQTKLILGAPDDAYEREADRLAAGVLQRLAAPAGAEPAHAGVVARSSVTDAGVRGGGEIQPDEEAKITAARGGGTPLDPQVQSRMEEGFGADFSSVRVHTGTGADQLNRSLTAQAFTTGRDIFFSEGSYRPGTSGGDSLLAHELAHTIQQGASVSRAVARRSAVPSVQALFGFGKKKPKAPPRPTQQLPAPDRPKQGPGKLVLDQFEVPNKILQEAEAGKAKVDDLEMALEYLDTRRQMVSGPNAPKGPEVADQFVTIEYLEKEISGLLQILNQVAATKQQAKDIYVGQGKKGGLKALSDSNDFFTNPVQKPGKGVAKNLDKAEIASLSTYTANDYKYINPATADNKGWLKSQMNDPKTGKQLTDQKGTVRDRTEEGGLHSGMMMSALAKLDVWSGDGFRGERLTPDEFKAQFDEEKGKVTPKKASQDKPAFWSVSTKEEVGKNFSNGEGDAPPPAEKTIGVLYRIKITNARNIAEFSKYPEAEVLCMPGAKFTITKVVKNPFQVGKGTPKATAYYEVTLQQTA